MSPGARDITNGGPCEELSELYNANIYVPIFITHFFNKPIQNPELLRTLYLEKDLSSYQIHKITKSRWSRAAISDAIRLLGIKKEVRKPPIPRFGHKVQKNKLVPHKGEQATLQLMLKLRAEG